jgi:uncharacterized protein (TIGR02466 family)
MKSPMAKKVAEIFPTVIVGYDNTNFSEMNPKLIEVLETMAYTPPPYTPEQTLDNHLEKHPAFAELFNWINQCLEDYRVTFKYQCDSLKPVLSWVNRGNKDSEHTSHTHPNSFISGIYYISNNPSPTFFEDPRFQIRNGISVHSFSKFGQNVWPCPSETGTLVLFPSWLEHYVDAQPNLIGNRYTLSFNAMPKGLVNGNGLTEITY